MLSMLLDGAEWLADLLAGIGELLLNIVKLFMPFLYYLATSCFSLLDLCQLMFRYLSGLEYYTLNGGKPITGDLFFRIFEKTFLTGSLKGGMWGTDGEYSVLAIAFWSLVIIAALLLLVTTIAAIIRIEYNPDKEKKNSKAGIMKNFFKALASFAIVPIASYFGLWLGNAVLFAVDSATTSQISSSLTSSDVKGNFVAENGSYSYFISGGFVTKVSGSDNTVAMKYPSISGLVNKVCLYDANKVRSEEGFYDSHIAGGGDLSLGVFDKVSGEEKSAQLIDDAFSLNAKLSTDQSAGGKTIRYLNRNDRDLVKKYYNLSNYNIILAAIYIFMGGKAILGLTFGLISRVVTLLGLLFLEPLVLSFMPIDNGTSFGEWRKYYIARILSIFMALLSMNVFYIVCPIFLTIDFFDAALIWANGVVHVIFIIALLGSITKIDVMFNKIISGEKIGADSAVSSNGAAVLNDTTAALGKVGKLAGTGIKLGANAVKLGARATLGVATAGFGISQAIRQKSHNDKSKKAGELANSKNLEMKGLEGKANRTNKEIFGEAAGTQYDKIHDDKMHESYNKYASKAGDNALSFEDWQEKTGEGSYMAARNSGKSLRDYYNETHGGGGSDADFNKWKQEGKAVYDQYGELGLKRGKNSSDSAYGTENNFKKEYGTKEQFAAKNEDLMNGKRIAKNEYERQMVEDAQRGISERDLAKEQYDKLKQERDAATAESKRHAEASKNAQKWKMSRIGFGGTLNNFGKTFKHVGDGFEIIGSSFGGSKK